MLQLMLKISAACRIFPKACGFLLLTAAICVIIRVVICAHMHSPTPDNRQNCFFEVDIMQKIKTTVHIAGKDYAISSYDSESYVQSVAAWVDRRMHELHQATRLPGAQLAVLTAVNATDDMMKSREENRRLRLELEEARKEIERLKKNAKA